MVSFRKTGGVDTGGMPEKILALSQYDTAIIGKLHGTKQNKTLVEKGAANMVAEYFMRLVDAKARANRSSLHHVYEFGAEGNSDARLFKKKLNSTEAGTVISFSFIRSKKPNFNGHIFYNKASVMESGETVVIKPRRGKFLAYSIDTGTSKKLVVTSKPSIVTNPGGDMVKGSFEKEWKDFSSHTAKAVLKQFRYFELINEAIRAKRKNVVPKINRGTVSGMIAEASKDASSIAVKAAIITNG